MTVVWVHWHDPVPARILVVRAALPYKNFLEFLLSNEEEMEGDSVLTIHKGVQ